MTTSVTCGTTPSRVALAKRVVWRARATTSTADTAAARPIPRSESTPGPLTPFTTLTSVLRFPIRIDLGPALEQNLNEVERLEIDIRLDIDIPLECGRLRAHEADSADRYVGREDAAIVRRREDLFTGNDVAARIDELERERLPRTVPVDQAARLAVVALSRRGTVRIDEKEDRRRVVPRRDYLADETVGIDHGHIRQDTVLPALVDLDEPFVVGRRFRDNFGRQSPHRRIGLFELEDVAQAFVLVGDRLGL